jgi:hypothetical protein
MTALDKLDKELSIALLLAGTLRRTREMLEDILQVLDDDKIGAP